MARAKSKSPPPGKWQYTVGDPPVQLTAYERADRGYRIYTRVWDGHRYGDKRPLCDAIRDKAGRVVPQLELAAQELVIARHDALVSGDGSEGDEQVPPGRLTLTAGFKRLLHPQKGKFATATHHAQETARALKLAAAVLGSDLLFADLKHSHYRQLWRHIAHEHVRSGRYGRRWAEMVIGALAGAARWLQQEGLVDPGDGEPARGWKAAMRREWEEITRRPAAGPNKPRYTPEETEALFAAAPKADPRVWLALEIGAELRLGQVLRSRRSDILAAPGTSEELYAVRVHGKGKKLGETVVLTDSQRAVLRHALTEGYLANLEREYREGRISDYYLIIGGRLREGKGGVMRARSESPDRPALTVGRLAYLWLELEELAGVEHQPGRRWYGMRRRQADAAEALDVSATAKNALGGWTKTSTREGYLEEGSMRGKEEAAQARERIRPRRGGEG